MNLPMGVVYPNVQRWGIPRGVLDITFRGVQPAGRCGRESGALWLGNREETSQISSVVLLRGAGVLERPNYWQVSPEVFAAVTRWATPRGLCLLALVHTHVSGVPPRLSWTDRHGGIRIPGVLAVVIGDGGNECDHQKWGWYVFQDGDYRRVVQSELRERVRVADHACEAWIADANSIAPLADK